MPSNTNTSAAVGDGPDFVTAQVTHDGDTAFLPGCFIVGISGTEDAYTINKINGDTTNGLDVDVTRVQGNVAITAASLPLPSGAATAANQSTANTILSALATEASLDAVVSLLAGTITVSASAFPSTVHSADFDTGAGTDTTLAFGIAVPASGGAAIVPGSATAGLKVDLGADNDVTIAGDALGSLQAIEAYVSDTALVVTNTNASATSLGVIDDWDESDRAKVNLIVGQAGITAGAGVVAANTPRVTLASDDPAVSNLNLIASNTFVVSDCVNGNTNGVSTEAAIKTDTMIAGSFAVTPKYATIDTATSGDNTIVDPAAGKKVRVLAFNLIAVGTAVNIYFKTGSTGKFGSSTRPIVLDKSGATGPGGFNSGFCPVGWFEGAADENLVLNLSAAQGVVGNVVYIEV